MNHWPKTGSILFVGKEFDYSFVHPLLCQNQPEKKALIDAGTHPDLLIIETLDQSKVIKIDQIRQLCEWANAKPIIASQKIAIIKDAHAMNIHAANALLKTLEEPHSHCLIILITEQLHQIIPTIRSRCYTIRHRTKDLTDNLLWQQVKNDCQNLREDKIEPVTLAQEWLKKDAEALLYWMLVVLYEDTKKFKYKNKAWWDLINKAWEVKRAVDDKMPYNLALMIENLLIEFTRVAKIQLKS